MQTNFFLSQASLQGRSTPSLHLVLAGPLRPRGVLSPIKVSSRWSNGTEALQIVARLAEQTCRSRQD